MLKVVTRDGKKLAMDRLTGNAVNTYAWDAMLFTNTPSPADDSVTLADLTEASFGTYARNGLTGWTVAALTADYHAKSVADQVDWEVSSPTTVNITGVGIIARTASGSPGSPILYAFILFDSAFVISDMNPLVIQGNLLTDTE